MLGLTIMPNMLSVNMLSVVMLNVVMLSVFMVSIVNQCCYAVYCNAEC